MKSIHTLLSLIKLGLVGRGGGGGGGTFVEKKPHKVGVITKRVIRILKISLIKVINTILKGGGIW